MLATPTWTILKTMRRNVDLWTTETTLSSFGRGFVHFTNTPYNYAEG